MFSKSKQECLHDIFCYASSQFVDSEFVEIKSNHQFIVAMQYASLGFKHAINRCYVRREVYDMLCHAQTNLPKGYKIKILDAWRPLALQKEIYKFQIEQIRKRVDFSQLSYEEQADILEKLTSYPVDNVFIAPSHTTGGAVDIIVVDNYGKEIDMEVFIDGIHGRLDPKSQLLINFNLLNSIIYEHNQRFLVFRAMNVSNFLCYDSKWWHFDYGNLEWAYRVSRPVLYKGVFEEKDLKICANI